MTKTNEIYVANIVYTGYKPQTDYAVSNDLASLKRDVLEKLIDFYCDEYPSIIKLRVPNSIYFIANYDEVKYQDKINKLITFLTTRKEKIFISFLKLEPKIENNKIEEVEHDIT